MNLTDFQEIVDEVVDNLPEEFAQQLSNVEIIAQAWPTQEELQSVKARHGTILFGLYQGVPKTKRRNYNAAVPDKILIFAGPIIKAFGSSLDAVKKQVRNTVLHEIGHHFGMSEEQIRLAEHQRLKNITQ